MSVTWGVLKSLMLEAMDAADVDVGVDRTPQMEWAMRTFCQHTPYQGTQPYTVSASYETVALPDDFLSPKGVFYTSTSTKGWGDFFGLGTGLYKESRGSEDSSVGWWIWPATNLNLLNMVGTADLYYYAYYPAIDDDDEEQVIPIPNWSIHPLIWLAIAYAKIPDSVQTADLARWSETSGERNYNPVMQQINYFQKQYQWEIALHSEVERTLIVPEGSDY
jgi:hypothetical protein